MYVSKRNVQYYVWTLKAALKYFIVFCIVVSMDRTVLLAQLIQHNMYLPTRYAVHDGHIGKHTQNVFVFSN